MGECGVLGHERMGYEFCRRELGLPERVCQPVLHHVNAKRYFCWKN